jgi:hypothetical protein
MGGWAGPSRIVAEGGATFRSFLGGTEGTIPRSRPAFRSAGSGGRVKGDEEAAS